jgi:ABC-type transporter Mla MlaB component
MTTDDDTSLVDMSGPLTLPEAEAIRDQLAAALAKGQPITVDCSGAAEVDLSFIQLLLSARRSAARQGLTLALAEPAAGALLTALRQAGFIGKHHPETAESQFWGKTTDV